MNATNTADTAEISEIVPMDSLRGVRKLLLSGDQEDLAIGKGWLSQLIGERDAEANYLVLLLNQSSEVDADIMVNDGTYAKMVFRTYATRFGKDYRYTVAFDAVFAGETIVYDLMDYSRYEVGDGQPKYDLTNTICTGLRKKGIKFYKELFIK
jgi:hypothetical protein